MAKATSFDIAELAGVSQPTVSRALSGSGTVSEATRKRIEAIARQLNYKVDKNASNLRRRHSETLALLLFEDPTSDESMINPFFLSMLGSITRTCAKRGYDLLISFQQMSANWHVDYEDSRKADGLILLGYGDYEAYRARIDQLVEQGTHFVRWGSVQPDQPGITIGCDNVQGGREATCHLIGLGRRRIAFLGEANSRYPEFLDRYRGYCLAHHDAGLPPPPLTLQADAITTEQSGQDAMRRILLRGDPPDAVFAASDLIAIGAMHALAEAGLSVPGDVAVVGFDDITAASLANPPLTTVAQDARRAGEMLVDTLLAQLRDETVEGATLPARLVVRRSTGVH
ncbi:MAG: LacI family DNA-binding transcriptional regulator [Sphingomonas oligoaromativorans]